MDNPMHLLATAMYKGAIGSALRRLAQCHVQSINPRHRRTGTLWEGRFKSCLVDSEHGLLSVYRYIELNPMRARMVERAEQHPWSRVHANAFLRTDPIVASHACYLALGTDASERATRYRGGLREGVDEEQLASLNRPATVQPRGRPRKLPAEKAN